MLGRNHAGWAAAAWVLAWPHLDQIPGNGSLDTSDIGLLAATGVVAAGSGVIPDLDHPDARPSRQFGLLSRLVAKTVAAGADGHRAGTHTLAFAAAVGLIGWLAAILPVYGRLPSVLWCGFCASVGLALVGPSINLRVHPLAEVAAAAGVGMYVWHFFDRVAPLLWLLAAGGVVVHILCDVVTKGGVPVFRPFSRRRFCLRLFRVGGTGEALAGLLGYGLLAFGVFDFARGF